MVGGGSRTGCAEGCLEPGMVFCLSSTRPVFIEHLLCAGPPQMLGFHSERDSHADHMELPHWWMGEPDMEIGSWNQNDKHQQGAPGLAEVLHCDRRAGSLPEEVRSENEQKVTR